MWTLYPRKMGRKKPLIPLQKPEKSKKSRMKPSKMGYTDILDT